ncbi:MAG: 1-acyl-sn-glycerol-3-phosphate acyltransferase [Ruminococcaceae bacterium]|nr:1-acyl-sn-glycerol-3-phosphate acyltransferase [Oscillospiraceae bacterium]
MVRYIMLALALLAAFGICIGAGGFAGLHWLWLLPVGFVGSLIGLVVLVFLVLWISCAFVNMEKPQKKDSPFYRGLVGFVANLVVWILRMRVDTKGLEQLPQKGRFLLVCNHLSLLDPVLLLAYFRKSQLAFISKRENNSMFLVGKVMHKLMCQLINRENDREALKTIIACIRLIQEDKVSVGVFPEGYIHGDGLLHPFRSGVFKIAQKTKVPIVVCTVQNTPMVKKNMGKLKPTNIHLHIVGVMQPEAYENLTTVDIADRVHGMMAEDLGPDLVLKETP